MKNKELNTTLLWKQFVDLLIPGLHLSLTERAVYLHLLRHSRLEGKLQLRFSIRCLARDARLSAWVSRKAVRSLIAKGALRLAERSKAGHFVEVLLPDEIPSLLPASHSAGTEGPLPRAGDLEVADFAQSPALREAIHSRDGGSCFYCLRQLSPTARCLDHAVPQMAMGGNSYRNLVSCCGECNSQKAGRRAEDFLRELYRQGRLATTELNGRLRALEALAAGKLRPRLPGGNDGA
jgi:5-methylcytosine-specific restriction endonuclease McrA